MTHAAQDTIHLVSETYRLSGAIRTLAHREIARTGIRWRAVPDAPNCWEDLASVDLSRGWLPVWDGGSENTIYDSCTVNFMFRYWHDMGHLTHGLGFTTAEELELQYDHHIPLVNSVVGRGTLAAKLYKADTVGQVLYTERHDRFPINQRAFVLAYVESPAQALAEYY